MLDVCEFAYWSEFTGRHPGFERKTEGIGITSKFVQKLSTLLHDPDQFCPSWSFFAKRILLISLVKGREIMRKRLTVDGRSPGWWPHWIFIRPAATITIHNRRWALTIANRSGRNTKFD